CGPGFVYGFLGREPRSEAEFRAKKASHSPVERFSALRRTTLDQRRCRSLTTADRIEPIHPGEVLMEDFIGGFGITQNKLAVSIGVPPRWINEIVHGKRGITADTALRLARYFGTAAEFWINLQSHYERDVASAERSGEPLEGNVLKKVLAAIGAAAVAGTIWFTSTLGPAAAQSYDYQEDVRATSCTTDAEGYCTIEHKLRWIPDEILVTPRIPRGQKAFFLSVVTGSYTEDGFEIRAVYHDGQPKTNSKVFVTYIARDTFSRGPHPSYPEEPEAPPSDPTSDPDGPPDTTTSEPPCRECET